MLIGIGVFAVLGKWCAALTGTEGHDASRQAAATLVTSAPLALLWLLAACGYGWPLRQWLGPETGERLPNGDASRMGSPLALQVAPGVAAMLVLDQTLGSLGILQFGGSFAAWTVVAIGCALLVAQLLHHRPWGRRLEFPGWLAWASAPAVTVLLIASCSAPGWLWESEFGGYDALSYHLQLPKEWLALGRIQPLEHNVYSFLPGYVEAAYYHLAILAGDAVHAAYACQLLHAGMALLTAWMVFRLATSLGGMIAGAVAASAMLATPWLIVAGSLAYNEMAVLLMLAAGGLAATDAAIPIARRMAIVGFLAGVACGAKLTAVGFAAAPLGAVIVVNLIAEARDVDSRFSRVAQRLCRGCALLVLCAATALLPYLIRNAAHAGNPVFPFATEILGTAHWTPEQVETWSRGHFSDSDLWTRARELWRQFMIYGIGANPVASEPWKPQWSIMPWLGLLAIAFGLIRLKQRRGVFAIIAAVLVIQVAFWAGLTHLKSRFLLPTIVPLSIAIGIAGGAIIERAGVRHRIVEATVAMIMFTLTTVVVWVYATQRDGAPAAAIGAITQLTGEALDQAAREELGRSTLPAVAVNDLLPPESRVLLIGDAKPFYYRARLAYHATWDRGALSRIMRQHPDSMTQWAAALRQDGFTHLLIDRAMLRVWARSGWNDPLMTVDRIDAFAGAFTHELWRYPGDVSLHELK